VIGDANKLGAKMLLAPRNWTRLDQKIGGAEWQIDSAAVLGDAKC